MIPKMRKKSSDIIITLRILGMAINKAYTAIFKPLFLLITLKGLSTLSNLRILIILSLLLLIIIEIIENKTITKSTAFHGFYKYEFYLLNKNPKAIIFNNASIAKNIVNTKSANSSILNNRLSGSFNGLSRASIILDITIRDRITISNLGDLTSLTILILKQLS